MVKEKEGYGRCCVVERWHGLSPFGEMVNHYDDILMVTSGWGLTLHKFDGPFIEGTNCDNGMEGSRRSSRLRGEMLEIGTVFDLFNTITEERRPKIPSTHDFLGGGEAREVATTSAAMAGIEDLLSFSMCEAMKKDSINTMMIEIVTDKKVAGGLVSNTSLSITIKVEGELLGSQVSEDISIPRIVCGNGKQVFIRKIIINYRVMHTNR